MDEDDAYYEKSKNRLLLSIAIKKGKEEIV